MRLWPLILPVSPACGGLCCYGHLNGNSFSMSNRDDFSSEVRRALAERAGHRCSFPGCNAVTVGPSDETETSVSKTGMACHIAAAAGGPGARRYIYNMEPEARASIENGVWMCYTHGKLIDSDEVRFTISMLKKWRELAEFRARYRQEHGSDKPLPSDRLLAIGFADHILSFSTLDNDTEVIGCALIDSCVPLVWGTKLGHAIRDVLVEILRNTFIHGKATYCHIVIRRHSIYVTDNGTDFNWLNLPNIKTGRGGAAAVKHIIERYGDKLVLGSKRLDNENQTMIALAHSFDDIALVSPCSFELSAQGSEYIRQTWTMPSSWFPSTTDACRVIYIILPEFMALSDAMLFSNVMKSKNIGDKHIVFVTRNTSCGVKEHLLGFFPTARVIDISSVEAV